MERTPEEIFLFILISTLNGLLFTALINDM